MGQYNPYCKEYWRHKDQYDYLNKHEGELDWKGSDKYMERYKVFLDFLKNKKDQYKKT